MSRALRDWATWVVAGLAGGGAFVASQHVGDLGGARALEAGALGIALAALFFTLTLREAPAPMKRTLETVRLGGAFVCYLWLVWSAAHLGSLHSPSASGIEQGLIFAGITAGNLLYGHFLIAEGRARERRAGQRPEGPAPPTV